MPTIEITDISAQELDVYTSLTEIQLRNRLEPEKGVFIAESPKVIELALDAGFEPLSMLTAKKHIKGQAMGIISRCPSLTVYTAPDEQLEALTGYKLTRGVLCAMRRPKPLEAEKICENARRVAVLEDIADAVNIGAIFRSAAAMNIDAVLLTPQCCDPLQRRALRVSMGTTLLIPWARIGSDQDDWLKNGVNKLHSMGFTTAAMALDNDSVSLDDERLINIGRLAVILGAEGDGLKKTTVKGCDYTVKIPMAHGVDSLNVAAAGAVAFWQLRIR